MVEAIGAADTMEEDLVDLEVGLEVLGEEGPVGSAVLEAGAAEGAAARAAGRNCGLLIETNSAIANS